MKLLIVFPILFLLFACSTNDTLFVTFDHSNGIVVGNPVLLKEIQIGEVKSIKLNKNYNVDIELKLNDDIQLPNDSKFFIGAKDMFTAALIVEPGSSKVYFTKTDQINNSKPVRNQDSIVTNLKEINQELKVINEKIQK